MPFAIAVLHHPVTSYALLVVALAGGIRAAYVRGAFVAGFAGVSAGLLAVLAYLSAPPSSAGLVTLALGATLLNVEFRVPTYGVAGIAGLVATALGSWWLLDLPPSRLGTASRFVASVAGSLALLAVVVRSLRRYSLPP